jgi:alpha-beta hydrolase superfamily lysophospholipase
MAAHTKRKGVVNFADMSSRSASLVEPIAAADMAFVRPGASPIPGRAWDSGTGMQGYVWQAPHPRAVLLLQHGYAEYSERFAKVYNGLLPHLLAAGVTVYAIDMPGHGRSPGKRGHVDASKAADIHLAARRRLREQLLPVFLFGHSLGGLVTATSVVRDTIGVHGVILSSPLLHRSEGRFLRWLASSIAAVAPGFPIASSVLDMISSIPEEVERAKSDPMIYRGRMAAIVASSGLRWTHENWKHYSSWRTPVLLLHGTEDKATDPEGSRRFYAMVPARDKTLHIVEGGYHELLNDVTRNDTLRVIMSWLEQRLPAHG